jgi:hypothetical protein
VGSLSNLTTTRLSLKELKLGIIAFGVPVSSLAVSN